MRFVFCLIILLAQYSYANFEWINTAQLITINSELQTKIDLAAKEIFSSKLHKPLCNVFSTAINITFSIGVSSNVANEISNSCSNDHQYQGLSKYSPKKYYIVQEGFANLDSWTDTENRTFIFTDQELTDSKLKAIIAHEIAIAVDGKTNMFFTTYLAYNAKSDNVITNHLALEKAFNFSTYEPVSLTFSAMRAFEIESIIENKISIVNDHTQCVQKFNQIYEVVKNIPKNFTANTGNLLLQSLLSNISVQSESISAEEEFSNLKHILSKDIKIEDLDGKTITFCEYMAKPLITNKTHRTALSRGPRPRTTGGSGEDIDTSTSD